MPHALTLPRALAQKAFEGYLVVYNNIVIYAEGSIVKVLEFENPGELEEWLRKVDVFEVRGVCTSIGCLERGLKGTEVLELVKILKGP